MVVPTIVREWRVRVTVLDRDIQRFARGDLGDRTAHLIVVIGAFFLSVIDFLSLVSVSGTPSVMLSIALIAVGPRSFPPVMRAHLIDIFVDKSAGDDLGALKAVYNLIGSLRPTYVGLAASGASYFTAFIQLVHMLFAAMCVTVWRFLEDNSHGY